MAGALLTAALLAAALIPAGCGSRGTTREEALKALRSAYLAMAETPGYRFRYTVGYEFPDMDEQTRAAIAHAPTPLSMEGEVQQGEGGYRQHAWTSGKGQKMDAFVMEGCAYRHTEATGWLRYDPSEFSLDPSALYDFSRRDFEGTLGFVGEVRVVEDGPGRLVVYFDAGSDYLLTALEKSRARYEARGALAAYDMLYGLLRNSSTGITNYIYKENGYLERQEVTMRLPDSPNLTDPSTGKPLTVELKIVNEFYDYGADVDIRLPAEAVSAPSAPAP